MLIPSSMFAIIKTRGHTRARSRRAKRRSSAAPGSLRKKYAGIVPPLNAVDMPPRSTTSWDLRKSVLVSCRAYPADHKSLMNLAFSAKNSGFSNPCGGKFAQAANDNPLK